MSQQSTGYWPKGLPRVLEVPRTTLHHNLQVSADRYPDKPAVIFYDSPISYGELLRQSERLAGYLQRHCGVNPGDRVVLYSQNCPQFTIGYYAILRAQAVVVPVNPMNLARELEYCVEDSGARVALVAQELLENTRPLLADRRLRHVVVHAYSDYLTEPTDVPVPDAVRAPREPIADTGVVPWHEALGADLAPAPYGGRSDDMCVLGYTSGTTGHPKGVVHTHSTMMGAIAASQVWRAGMPTDVVLAIAPFFHFLGMQAGLNGPIYTGASVVMMQRWDRDTALRMIERHGVTNWAAPPAMLVDFFANPALAAHDISSLRLLSGGGAAMPEAVSRRLKDEFGIHFNEAYGLTESAAFILSNPVGRGKRQCLGIATFNVDARIVDPDTLEALPQGEVGELILHGPQVMKGYWNDRDATAAALVERDGKRFLRTGDLAYVDDEGYYFMVDRLKRMINASGFKVWPAEVESIMYAHPDIHEACVVAVPDPKRGETPQAVVVLKPGAAGRVGESDLIDWCRDNMAAYKVPTTIELVDELPKSATGKVLWRELQERARVQVD